MEQISLFSSLCGNNNFPNSILYQGFPIFLTRQKDRRTLSLSVEFNGQVQIMCSASTSQRVIKQFLSHHWVWIQKQIKKRKEKQIKYPVKKFRSGESFLFQGKILKLKYEKDNASMGIGFRIERSYIIYKWNEFCDLNREILKEKLISFYEQTGQKVLREHINQLSQLMELYPKYIRIAGQKSLWGSCSAQGTISLNWRLLAAPIEVLMYVVVHELAHLKYLNHSPDFWFFVSKWCPQYRTYEKWLRDNQEAMDFLLPSSELHGRFT